MKETLFRDPQDYHTLAIDADLNKGKVFPELDYSHNASDFGIQNEEDAVMVNALVELRRYEEERKRPVEIKARIAWEQYNGFYSNDTLKDVTQSQKVFPNHFMTTERFAAAILRLRQQDPNWFVAESLIPQQQVIINLVNRWVQYQCDHPLVGFNQVFSDLIHNGLITSQMYAMISHQTNGIPVTGAEVDAELDLENTDDLFQSLSDISDNGEKPSTSQPPFAANKKMPRLLLECLDPSHVWLDTSSRKGRYRFWETNMGVGQFLEEAKLRGWDINACKRAALKKKPIETFENRDDFQQGVNPDDMKNYHNEVVLTHFEGTFHDIRTGYIYFHNKYMIMANHCEIILPPVDIPFWDGESVMVDSPFVKVANAVYGKSPITENIDSFALRHDIMNLLVDFFKMNLKPGWTVDQDRLHPILNPEIDGIYPGKVIYIQNNGPATGNQKVVDVVASADLPTGFWQFMQFYQTTYAENTGMGQELMGMNRTRGRITKGEFDARSAEGSALLIEFFQGIEERLLTPLLTRMFTRTLQYTPQRMWAAWIISNMEKILPPVPKDPQAAQKQAPLRKEWEDVLRKVANWAPRERFDKLGGFFRFKVKVFSSLLERQGMIEQATYFLQTAGRIPGALQFIKIPKMLEKIAIGFGWDPEEILNLNALPVPKEDSELLNQVMNGEDLGEAPDLLMGLGSMFTPGPTFSPEQIGGNVDTSSGSPAPGTGAPSNPVPSQVKPRF